MEETACPWSAMVEVHQESAWVPHFFWPGSAGQLGQRKQRTAPNQAAAQPVRAIFRHSFVVYVKEFRSPVKPTMCALHENSDKLVALLDSTALNGWTLHGDPTEIREESVHHERIQRPIPEDVICQIVSGILPGSSSPPDLDLHQSLHKQNQPDLGPSR